MVSSLWLECFNHQEEEAPGIVCFSFWCTTRFDRNHGQRRRSTALIVLLTCVVSSRSIQISSLWSMVHCRATNCSSVSFVCLFSRLLYWRRSRIIVNKIRRFSQRVTGWASMIIATIQINWCRINTKKCLVIVIIDVAIVTAAIFSIPYIETLEWLHSIGRTNRRAICHQVWSLMSSPDS